MPSVTMRRWLTGVLVLSAIQGCASSAEIDMRRAVQRAEPSNEAQTVSGTQADDSTGLDDANLENAGLEGLLAYAVQHNEGLAAAFENWRAGVEHVPQARSLADPRASWTWFVSPVETRVGPQQHRLSISQAFPWFGTLAARGDAALEAARAAERRYEAARLRLSYEVQQSYAQLYYVTRALEITQQNLGLLEQREVVARARFRVATGTHADVIKAQVEIGVETDRARSLADQLEAAQAQLNAVLGRATDAPLAMPRQLPRFAPVPDDTVLVALLAETSPELSALEHEVAARTHLLDVAQKSGWPDFALGVDWIVTGEAAQPGVQDSGRDALAAQVAVRLPLWRGRVESEKRVAAARIRAARFALGDQRKRLAADVERVAFELRDAERKVRLYRDTLVPKGEQSLRAAGSAYENGTATFLSVVDAQRVLQEILLSAERARSDRLTRRAEIEMLLGQELPGTSQ